MTPIRGPQRVLVLGGTRWLGRCVAQAHLDRGAAVTCLARGEGGDAPAGARLVLADRERADAYDGLAGEWDEVIDVTRRPAHAAGALDALGGRARHWTFVSSVSAQRVEGAPVGAGEDDELVPEDESGEEYGGAKAWIERVARERLGDRLAIVRPGLIGGPGDESGRFGYWVSRLALAGPGPVLVPARDQPTQAIDVRDLVAFLVEAAPTRSDIVNAVGPVAALHEHLAVAGEIAGHTGELVEASDAQLDVLGIEHWAGARALPLTLPAALAAHAQRASERYRAAGGRHRPLHETLAAVLVDELAAIDSLASLS